MTSAAAADWRKHTQQVADGIRRRVLQHTLDHNGGYMSQACSSAEIFAMLYTRILHIGESTAPLIPRPFSGVPSAQNPDFFTGDAYNGPRSPEFDQFIFSPAHYALVLYSALIEVGRLAEEALEQFNQDGSTVEMIGAEHSPGVATTTGSLAQAISQAGGIALARRLKREPGRVWVMMSDGEFQEGQVWEAIAAASYHGLDNLRVVADVNGQQCDGCVDDVGMLEPLADRITAFGGSVDEPDGHDLEALDAALRRETGKPHFVLARTDPVHGLPVLGKRAPFLHYLRFTSPEERAAYQDALEKLVG